MRRAGSAHRARGKRNELLCPLPKRRAHAGRSRALAASQGGLAADARGVGRSQLEGSTLSSRRPSVAPLGGGEAQGGYPCDPEVSRCNANASSSPAARSLSAASAWKVELSTS